MVRASPIPRPGSSPLARGLRPACPGGVVPRGIIPARAGFTIAVLENGVVMRDHPRSRGVYRRRPGWLAALAGSSPLARGLHADAPWDNLASGIIPARAGFTLSETGVGPPGSDHPRSRGVYGRRLDDIGHIDRIIPARAGFTGSLRFSGLWPGDHPRSRGVYHAILSHAPSPDGSSPLARGLP